jgi:hypothetical protein
VLFVFRLFVPRSTQSISQRARSSKRYVLFNAGSFDFDAEAAICFVAEVIATQRRCYEMPMPVSTKLQQLNLRFVALFYILKYITRLTIKHFTNCFQRAETNSFCFARF